MRALARILFMNLPSITHFHQITLFVIAIHAILISWMILTPFSPVMPRQNERLIVKTIELSPPPPVSKQVIEPIPEIEPILKPEIPPELEAPPQVIEEAPKIEPIKKMEKKPSSPSPAKKNISKKKPPTEKKPIKKIEPVKKKVPPKQTTPAPKKTIPKKLDKPLDKPKVDSKLEAAKSKAQQEAQEKQRKLIAAAQENLAKIDQGRAKMSAAKSSLGNIAVVPVAIKSLQIEALPDSHAPPMTSGEKSYRDELASRLKLMLKLPEHGDVHLKLTLDRMGKVVNVKIVKSASSMNRNTIEKNLPNLKFPPFGNHFENMSEYTFIIQLSNEL